jgi:hypothetical protein
MGLYKFTEVTSMTKPHRDALKLLEKCKAREKAQNLHKVKLDAKTTVYLNDAQYSEYIKCPERWIEKHNKTKYSYDD